MTKTITVGKDGFVLLDNFKQYVNVRKVEFYSVRLNKDKTITIKFYDKKKKLVKLNEPV